MRAPSARSPLWAVTTRPVLSRRLIHDEKIKLATNKNKVSQMKKLFQSFSGEMEVSIASPIHSGVSAVRSACKAMHNGVADVLTRVPVLSQA